MGSNTSYTSCTAAQYVAYMYVLQCGGDVCGCRCGLVEVMNETWLMIVGKYLSAGVAGWVEVEARGGNNSGFISDNHPPLRWLGLSSG